jgi:DNA-binding MarR family transcriptional regulator
VAERLNERELGAYFALIAAGELLQKAVAGQLREYGLTPVQFAILMQLREQPAGARMGDLATSLVVTRSGLTYQIGRLEAEGLVERHSAGADERGVVAQITPSGRERVEAALPGHIDLLRRAFLDLVEPGEIDPLRRILARVAAGLGHTGLVAPSSPPTPE